MAELRQGGSKNAELAIKATFAARNRVLAAHKEEFDLYLTEERTARGLPPKPGNVTNQRLKLRVAELEAQLRELEV